MFVTTNFFDTFGVGPALGRHFGPPHGTAGGSRVVILSYGLWQSRFGGDRAIWRRTILLDGRAHEVLGVMPAQFAHPENAVLWAPLAPTERFAELLQGRGWLWLTIVGQLEAGGFAGYCTGGDRRDRRGARTPSIPTMPASACGSCRCTRKSSVTCGCRC